MTTEVWSMLVVAALVLGAVAGGWGMLRYARMRFDAQLRSATDELRQRNSAMAEQLRTAQVRSQTELEQARNTFKRQLADLSSEPRVALERAEARLKSAYAELDRLRKVGADTAPTDLSDGFAATRPMREGL
ncbi:MAG: hypothetical protein ABI702_10360 [Burkholderiales bacterium]